MEQTNNNAKTASKGNEAAAVSNNPNKKTQKVKTDWKEKYFNLKDEFIKKVQEKEQLIRWTEEECDEKVANRDLVIDALRQDVARLNKLLDAKTKELAKYNRWGWFWTTFGRKHN